MPDGSGSVKTSESRADLFEPVGGVAIGGPSDHDWEEESVGFVLILSDLEGWTP